MMLVAPPDCREIPHPHPSALILVSPYKLTPHCIYISPSEEKFPQFIKRGFLGDSFSPVLPSSFVPSMGKQDGKETNYWINPLTQAIIFSI
jgi:hypothetical protein